MNSFHTGLYSLNSFPPGNAVPCGAFRELCLFHPDCDRWSRVPTGVSLRISADRALPSKTGPASIAAAESLGVADCRSPSTVRRASPRIAAVVDRITASEEFHLALKQNPCARL